MSVDYTSKHPIDLQAAVRDLEARLKKLEPKPWKPDPPKK